MRRPNLAQLLIESSRKAQEVLAHNRQVERITAAVQPSIAADAAKKAESNREVVCPHCNETFTTSWKSDPVTSESGQDDEDNEGDGANGADQDDDEFDNLRRIDRLNALTKSLTAATERAQR
jgi:hypothetical protein